MLKFVECGRDVFVLLIKVLVGIGIFIAVFYGIKFLFGINIVLGSVVLFIFTWFLCTCLVFLIKRG